jgi:hypothetical protein
LHAPTSSTQKLKLIGKGGQFTYTPTSTTSACFKKNRIKLYRIKKCIVEMNEQYNCTRQGIPYTFLFALRQSIL